MNGDRRVYLLCVLCVILVPPFLLGLNARSEQFRNVQTLASAALSSGTGNPSEANTIATKPDRGNPVDGLSVQLTSDKAVWDLGELVIFKVSVRNQGSETLSVAQTQQPGELEVDGVWYLWSNPYYVTRKPLMPGQQIDNVRVTYGAEWRSGLKSLVAGPGKHRFRFAVVARRGVPTPGPDIRAVSNPVEVEFQWPARTPATTAPATNAPTGSPILQPPSVYFSGRVVDDETDQPITNFALQFAGTYPQKPEQLTWKPDYRGQDSRDTTGRFWGEEHETGKTWARILAEGYEPQPVTPEPVVSPVHMENLVVRLKRGGEVRGVVLDHAGNPMAGAQVCLAGTQRLELTNGKPGGIGYRSGWVFKGGTATTDAAGRFTVRGGNGSEQSVAVVSADGQMVWAVPTADPGQELEITLPPPAVMIVRYDIPDDAPEAQLQIELMTRELEGAAWKDIGSVLEPKVANGEQIVLNVTPGEYRFARTKMLAVGDGGHGVFFERRTAVIEAGQTQRVDLVRSAGYSIQGEVTGLKDADAPGAYIFVRSAEATGDPGQRSEALLPSFDALTCGKDGIFHTARLDPGTYTIVVEAYEPDLPQLENIGGRQMRVWHSGIRLPAYVGTAKVTVRGDAPPPPVKIVLSRRPETK